MKTYRSKYLISALVIIVLSIWAIYATSARNAEASKTKIYLDLFEKAFAPTHWRAETFFLFPQIWRQEKLICIIADEQEIFLSFMISTIETISATYEKQHEVRVVPSPEHCPNNHYSIVIYYGKNPGFEGFKSIFSKLTECASKNNSIDFEAPLAFTIFLPGGTKRTFIFINKIDRGIHSKREYLEPIFIEELMHALSAGYDVSDDELISILAENHNVATYEKWYTKNPRGLCEFDLMVLELILNKSEEIEHRRYVNFLNYFEVHFNDLAKAARAKHPMLEAITDPRCRDGISYRTE
jgi:hypothetical protein